jgi:hypothetical protein
MSIKTVLRVCVAALVPTLAAAQQPGVTEAAATITEADFMSRIGVIAHDSMQGRNTPSPGLDRTAEWIAAQFEEMGLRGGGDDGGFIQRYPLRSVVVDTVASALSGGGQRLAYGADMVQLTGRGDVDLTGGVVLFSGSLNFQAAAAAAPLAGNHVVLLLGEDSPGVSRMMVVELSEGGAASILVSTPMAAGRWDLGAIRSLRPVISKGWGGRGRRVVSSATPVMQVRAEALDRALGASGVNATALRARTAGDVEAQLVEGLEMTLTVAFRDEQITAPNVVAILEGSDPQLKDEYVVFSAHMDHVGIGVPDANGDSIFNGADDDASGTVAIVEVAEAMTSLPTPPRRSMVFLLVSGEEKGLWGSEWHAANPSAPIDKYVANLNADMVGRNWGDTIVAIGKEHSDLGETLNRVNGNHPELNMTAIDDIWPDERFYFRSDHYNFARNGVPVLFFFNGTHDDYHGRDDEPDRIDAEKAARISKLIFYLGVDIANRDERPEWDPESYREIVTRPVG